MYKTNIEIEGTTIAWGGATFESYKVFGACWIEEHNLREMVKLPEPVIEENSSDVWAPSVISYAKTRRGKELFQSFTEVMGCTPSAALRTLNKIMYKVWIAPIGRDVVWAYCRENATVAVKRYLNANKLVDMHTHMDKIFICQVDNQKHLIPLCVALKSSPKQIKDKVSKSLWKHLINNSLTRNGFIAANLEEDSLWESLAEVSQISSSLLKAGYANLVAYNDDYEELEELKPIVLNRLAVEGKFLTKSNKLKETWDLLKDTASMADELGMVVNLNWKLKRWHEEHAKLSREITAREYSPEKFTHSGMPKLRPNIRDSGYIAKLLDSRLAIGMEGRDMGHCVASYAEQAAKGSYAVYNITSPSGERSTLGLRVDKEGKPSFDQHYGKYNARIDTTTAQFGRNIVMELNNQPHMRLGESAFVY